MTQPAEVERTAQQLIALYERAQDDIRAELEAIAATPSKAGQRRRLRAAAAEVQRQLDALEATTATWLTTQLPYVYELGATATSVQMGEAFVWTSSHANAVQQLATRTWDELLSATTYTREETKRWLRDQVRRQAGLSLVEGRTSQQAARALVGAAGEAVEAIGAPVGYVRYKDGSYRTLADYADTALRTEVAVAHNAGSLNQMAALNVTHAECVDGMGCGLTSHDDGNPANGKVFPIATAMSYPTAHPRCRRSWIARPEVRSAAEARAAEPLRSPEQMADQAAAEVERARTLTQRRTNRQARAARAPRAPRSPRRAAS
jgi:hypothetical protein